MKLVWLSVWSEVQTCIWPSGFHCHLLCLASVKSRLVLPFWYWLTRVVLDKESLNRCVCVLYNAQNSIVLILAVLITAYTSSSWPVMLQVVDL